MQSAREGTTGSMVTVLRCSCCFFVTNLFFDRLFGWSVGYQLVFFLTNVAFDILCYTIHCHIILIQV